MRTAIAIALAAAAALPGAAGAAPEKLPSGPGEVRMVEMSGPTSEKTLVEAFVPAAKDQPMEALLYDLNGDGSPEVFARLKGKGMCDETGRVCRTIVFRKEVRGWVMVFDRPSQRIETRASGYAGMRGLVVDGRETYAFTNSGYKLDFAASGKPIEMKPAPAAYKAALAAQFGVGAERLALKGALRGRPFEVKVATVAPKDGEALILARIEGPGTCGVVLGCPWRLLRVKDGAYQKVSSGFSGDRMALLPVARGGYRDIAAETPEGYDVYAWSGERYGVFERRKEGSVR